MTLFEIVLLAIGLSMDSLAVSVTGGAVIRNCTAGNVLKIASVMGLFQGSLTLIGYLMGLAFAKYINVFDHWIAFTLLLYLGGKMIYDSLKKKEEEKPLHPLKANVLCGLALATSIDALAVGVSLALLDTSILLDASIIGLVTFLISGAGVLIGSRFGRTINLKFDLLGGGILVAIGTKILVEHLFLIS